MSAYRTDLRSLCADYDVTAVSALPYLDLALSKNFLSLNILKESSVSLFVVLLDGLVVGTWTVVVAIHPCFTDNLDQVVVAHFVLGQQDQVPPLLSMPLFSFR